MERFEITAKGTCRICGAEREFPGISPESLVDTLMRLPAYVCEEGDHHFKPETNLLDAYRLDIPGIDNSMRWILGDQTF